MASRVYVKGAPEFEGRAAKAKKFALRSTVCFVTWSQSRTYNHKQFYRKLQRIVPSGIEIFGGKELHRDGNPHYYAVLRFPYRVNWQDARRKLMVPGPDGDVDTEAIWIVVPDKTESVGDFLRRT